MTSEIRLLGKAKGGDRKAMSALYDRYAKAMYNIAVRILGNEYMADDVLQEAFLSAFSNFGQLKEDGQFGGWLKRIVINCAIMAGRKKMRVVEIDDARSDCPEETTDEEEWWAGIGMDEIHRSVKTLPDGCREVFTLYAIEDYSHREIATLLGISEGTSKSQYFRARQLMKLRLTKEFFVHG